MRDLRAFRTLVQLCERTGAGKRSVESLVPEEIGTTLGKSPQQLRPMQGMRLLAEHKSDPCRCGGLRYAERIHFYAQKRLGRAPTRILDRCENLILVQNEYPLFGVTLSL